jgi:uncharacterized protein (TIGR02646 family)
MIYVGRGANDEAGMLIQPSDAWIESAADSTARAIEEGEEHEIEEDVYRHPQVRAALEKLFHDKCAYCEWKPTGGSDWDVEHYRPKGRVAEREDHPGYYWLAYTWGNLYLACTHCNQNRKDKPRWDDPTESPAGGKVDQFPLYDEGTRVMSPDGNANLLDEHTLLIDPCYDPPEVYLGFDATGQVFSLNGNPYGEATIRVFRLWRRRLRDLRREKLVGVVAILKLILKYAGEGNQGVVEDLRDLLNAEKSDDSQFAAVARYVEDNPAFFGIA